MNEPRLASLPSGKVGYVSADAISPLGNDQVCYVKDGAGWVVRERVQLGSK